MLYGLSKKSLFGIYKYVTWYWENRQRLQPPSSSTPVSGIIFASAIQGLYSFPKLCHLFDRCVSAQISARNTLGSIATAMYSTVLSNRNLVNIPLVVGPAAVAAGLPAEETAAVVAASKAGTPAAYASVPGMTPEIEAAAVLAVRMANAMSFRTMFLITLAFGLAATISSTFVGNLDHHLTDDVSRKLQDKRPGRDTAKMSEV